MKSVLAVAISAVLCLQNACLSNGSLFNMVSAMPAKEYILSEDTQDMNESQETVGEETTGDQDAASAAGPEVSAPSAILMEASTGDIIFEKDSDTARPPASVTKIMTMLLIFDALAEGKIKLEDQVTTSEFAASMGGSQVFLEPGETQSVDTMLKCISVASANDACVAFHNSRKILSAPMPCVICTASEQMR